MHQIEDPLDWRPNLVLLDGECSSLVTASTAAQKTGAVTSLSMVDVQDGKELNDCRRAEDSTRRRSTVYRSSVRSRSFSIRFKWPYVSCSLSHSHKQQIAELGSAKNLVIRVGQRQKDDSSGKSTLLQYTSLHKVHLDNLPIRDHAFPSRARQAKTPSSSVRRRRHSQHPLLHHEHTFRQPHYIAQPSRLADSSARS